MTAECIFNHNTRGRDRLYRILRLLDANAARYAKSRYDEIMQGAERAEAMGCTNDVRANKRMLKAMISRGIWLRTHQGDMYEILRAEGVCDQCQDKWLHVAADVIQSEVGAMFYGYSKKKIARRLNFA